MRYVRTSLTDTRVRPSVRPSVCLSVCLSVRLSVLPAWSDRRIFVQPLDQQKISFSFSYVQRLGNKMWGQSEMKSGQSQVLKRSSKLIYFICKYYFEFFFAEVKKKEKSLRESLFSLQNVTFLSILRFILSSLGSWKMCANFLRLENLSQKRKERKVVSFFNSSHSRKPFSHFYGTYVVETSQRNFLLNSKTKTLGFFCIT